MKREIVLALGANRSRDALTYRLCEKYGLGWQEASALVEETAQEETKEIARRKAPAL